MKKKILFVNWGTSDKEYTFKVAHEKDLNIFLATSRNYPKWLNKYVSKEQLIFTNTYDSEKLIIDVAAYLYKNKMKLDAITTFFEMNIVQTADLASALGYKFISPKAARQSSGNKLLMKLRCQEKRIAIPKFTVFNNRKDGLKGLKKIGTPAVLKPVKSGHSFGAAYIDSDDEDEFLKIFIKARKQLDSKIDEWMEYYDNYKEDFLLEEYLSGPVVSVDGLIKEGRIMICGFAEFIMSSLPFLLQERVYIPASFSTRIKKSCFLQAKKIIKALEFDNCGFHCEMKLTKKRGPILLEIAARPPGGNMLAGYFNAYGIDFTGLYLDIFLENKTSFKKPRSRKFVVHGGITAKKRGIIKKIEGLNKIKRLKSLTNLSYEKKGNLIDFFGDNPEALLSYRLTCKNRRQLKNDERVIFENFKACYYPKIYFYFRKIVRAIRKFFRKILKP